ncbi:MAG: hypothetical protein Q4D29_00455 [Lachnospiraceae bacterium]|nr:hypothetical protein [Lachnospiraceae bacterium]
MNIRLDYYAANRMLREMENVAKEVKDEIENMEESIENLGIFWESESSSEYAMRITTDFYVAKALLASISSSINVFAELVQRFDAAERCIRGLIEGM